MAQGGKREGAGRKKGSLNKRTLEVRDLLDSMGCNPIAGLADIALGKPVMCSTVGTDGKRKVQKSRPTLDQMLSARAKLSEYYAPKLKAIEHSGSIGTHEETLEALDESPDAD